MPGSTGPSPALAFVAWVVLSASIAAAATAPASSLRATPPAPVTPSLAPVASSPTPMAGTVQFFSDLATAHAKVTSTRAGAEIFKYMARLDPAKAHPCPNTAVRVARCAMNQADYDGNFCISEDEAAQKLNSFNPVARFALYRLTNPGKLMRKCDLDENGCITYSEFVHPDGCLNQCWKNDQAIFWGKC